MTASSVRDGERLVPVPALFPLFDCLFTPPVYLHPCLFTPSVYSHPLSVYTPCLFTPPVCLLYEFRCLDSYTFSWAQEPTGTNTAWLLLINGIIYFFLEYHKHEESLV